MNRTVSEVEADLSKLGCYDGCCVVFRPRGMHTNGGCRCVRNMLDSENPRGKLEHVLRLAQERLHASPDDEGDPVTLRRKLDAALVGVVRLRAHEGAVDAVLGIVRENARLHGIDEHASSLWAIRQDAANERAMAAPKETDNALHSDVLAAAAQCLTIHGYASHLEEAIRGAAKVIRHTSIERGLIADELLAALARNP